MVPGMRPKGSGQLVWCLYFWGFFYPGEALPPAAGMDGWHGWGVVKFELLSPLWWSCPKVLGSAGTSQCHPPALGGDTRQEKEAAVARCEEAEREGFGGSAGFSQRAPWGSEGVPWLQREFPHGFPSGMARKDRRHQ